MARQLSLIKDPRKNTKLWWIVKQSVYGGSLNYRKVRRPFSRKKITHAVFKAQLGTALHFTKFESRVRAILKGAADRYGIRVKTLAIQNDHIHILFFTKSHEAQTRFLRFFSAELGRRYARLRRRLGYAKKSLWVARPFTRLVSWAKKSVTTVQSYIKRNRLEAMGFLKYKTRTHRLNGFLKQWALRSVSTA